MTAVSTNSRAKNDFCFHNGNSENKLISVPWTKSTKIDCPCLQYGEDYPLTRRPLTLSSFAAICIGLQKLLFDARHLLLAKTESKR